MSTHAPSSRLIGAILLIAGTTIGAGMLALPVATGRAGFFPSIIEMTLCWLFLVFSALCLLEVNLTLQHKGNLISMATETLGIPGKIISWGAYLFLLYALNTAYIAETTSIFQKALEAISGVSVAKILCALPLLGAFGLLLRHGMHIVDEINRFLMAGLIFSFIFLLCFAFPYVHRDYFLGASLSHIPSSLSLIFTAFGFHIIIPSLVSYLHSSVRELKAAIWIGSFIPLVVYILWQVAVVGSVPLHGAVSLESAYAQGKSGAEMLFIISSSPFLGICAQAFAFFAIITSFLGVSISLFDFLADGLKIEKRKEGKWQLFFFTFVPPLYFSFSYPRAFFSALEYAGAFGVVLLLALIPALMVWRKRYALGIPSPYQVPCGKFGLIIFILLAIGAVVLEVLRKCSLLA
jgi:tyrosine-specific transport protein